MRDMKALLGAVVLLVGCGTSGGGIALEDFPEAMSGALCAHYFGCCSPEQIERVLVALPAMADQAECERVFEENQRALIEGQTPSFEAGYLRYSPEAAGACLAHLEALSCGQGEALCDPDAFFLRQQAAGEPCLDWFSCRAGTCEKADPADPLGTCTTTGALGERCAEQADCQAGLTCACAHLGWFECAQRYCRSYLPQGSECLWQAACSDELICDMTSRTCEPGRPAGEACQDYDCAHGLMCDVETSRCVAACF